MINRRQMLAGTLALGGCKGISVFPGGFALASLNKPIINELPSSDSKGYSDFDNLDSYRSLFKEIKHSALPVVRSQPAGFYIENYFIPAYDIGASNSGLNLDESMLERKIELDCLSLIEYSIKLSTRQPGKNCKTMHGELIVVNPDGILLHTWPVNKFTDSRLPVDDSSHCYGWQEIAMFVAEGAIISPKD